MAAWLFLQASNFHQLRAFRGFADILALRVISPCGNFNVAIDALEDSLVSLVLVTRPT